MLQIRLRAQQRLERGIAPGLLVRVAARAYASLVRVERPLRCDVPTLCVGGATLGGSGKTPLAIAAARALAERGHRVALVGHAYRAQPGRARFVAPGDDVRLVGDEALEAARELADTTVRVVVAPSRQLAVDLATSASGGVDVLVLDGPLQLTPKRARLSWLAVDEQAPWGSGDCPPAGDLRAPKAALVASADRVVPVRGASRGAWEGARLVPWSSLRALRVGLVTSVARPQRVLSLLGRHGIEPRAVLLGPDHGPLPLPGRHHRVESWLTTGKDWGLLQRGVRVSRIDYHLRLPSGLLAELHEAFPLCDTPSRF